MSPMIELHRKKYRLEIEVRNLFFLKKKLVFNYKQATLSEILEMTYMAGKTRDFMTWFFDFLNSCGKISKRQFASISDDHMFALLEIINKTFGKGYFNKNAIKPTTTDYTSAPESSSILMILEKSSTSMPELLGMTWEQIEYIIEGVQYNANAESPKGKRRNQMNMMKKRAREMGSDEDALKRVKSFESKLQHAHRNRHIQSITSGRPENAGKKC